VERLGMLKNGRKMVDKWWENAAGKGWESEKCWKLLRKWMNMLEKVGNMLNIGANMIKT
jgi:hypothetical protein